ncbi:MAG: L-2-amino-thiazoline-4-carboxylic acid hydrolase [bacterium]
MGMPMGAGERPNRVQASVCRRAVVDALGEAAAEAVMRETGIDRLPESLPLGPRDLETLGRELQPFVDLYRVVLARSDRETALRVARYAILESGRVSHAGDASAQRKAVTAGTTAAAGLNLTSPPPPGFQASPEEIERQFDVGMSYFSCQGRLLAYTPDYVRFHITDCNWVRAMQRAGVPELIPFFCETDERFMDGHPTHRLVRPTAIGLGDDHCDFQYIPRSAKTPPQEGDKG